ncbi:MAG: hypothetical protein ACE365_03325 [Gammaproteobacteria bacterium]
MLPTQQYDAKRRKIIPFVLVSSLVAALQGAFIAQNITAIFHPDDIDNDEADQLFDQGDINAWTYVGFGLSFFAEFLKVTLLYAYYTFENNDEIEHDHDHDHDHEAQHLHHHEEHKHDGGHSHTWSEYLSIFTPFWLISASANLFISTQLIKQKEAFIPLLIASALLGGFEGYGNLALHSHHHHHVDDHESLLALLRSDEWEGVSTQERLWNAFLAVGILLGHVGVGVFASTSALLSFDITAPWAHSLFGVLLSVAVIYIDGYTDMRSVISEFLKEVKMRGARYGEHRPFLNAPQNYDQEDDYIHEVSGAPIVVGRLAASSSLIHGVVAALGFFQLINLVSGNALMEAPRLVRAWASLGMATLLVWPNAKGMYDVFADTFQKLQNSEPGCSVITDFFKHIEDREYCKAVCFERIEPAYADL